RHAAFLHLPLRLQHALVVVRDDADKLRQPLIPLQQNFSSADAAGVFRMSEDHVLDRLHLVTVFPTCELDHLPITTLRKIALFVEHIGNTAGHPSGEVAAGLAQHHHATTGHVLTTVIAQGFDHRVKATVTHTKPLTGNTGDVGLSAGSAVERYVSDDYVFL